MLAQHSLGALTKLASAAKTVAVLTLDDDDIYGDGVNDAAGDKDVETKTRRNLV